MKHTVEKLGGRQESQTAIIASSAGGDSRKKLSVTVYFDGGGFALVMFFVEDHDNIESFSTFDAAVESYNEKP